MPQVETLIELARGIAADLDQLTIGLAARRNSSSSQVEQTADLHSRMLIAAKVLEEASSEGPISDVDLRDFDDRLAGIQCEIQELSEEMSSFPSGPEELKAVREGGIRVSQKIETLREEVAKRIEWLTT